MFQILVLLDKITQKDDITLMLKEVWQYGWGQLSNFQCKRYSYT